MATRLDSLDLIRGIAVLGLPFMNIITFAMPMSAYLNPLSWDTTNPLNYPFFLFASVFFDQRFLCLFALLFGAGAALLKDKLVSQRGRAVDIFVRRQLWLLLFGFLHAWFLWNGDILFIYALLGLLLYPLLRLSVSGLYGGFALFMVLALYFGAISAVTPTQLGADGWRDLQAVFTPDDVQLLAYRQIYLGDYDQLMQFMRGGNWDGGEMAGSAMDVLTQLLLSVACKALAMMCLGAALLRQGVLQGRGETSGYQRLALMGIGSGLLMSLWGVWWNHARGWDMAAWLNFGSLPNLLASVLMSLGYMGALCLWLQSGKWLWLQQGIRRVGQMALSNYLSQSLILAWLFFGWGLGWYASLGREMLFVVALLIGIGQIMLSSVWLAYFRQGPMEWLWRALTWWTVPPVRKH
ncbi:DUF418 domain-containing protein [Shewanella sp. GXUN23E]|uniref:DUF418 domain-containing protein n=1 Tax=Shewanella sp. GXUN23E TaxID=3422498 RepID=UPI003D7E86C1